MPLAYLSAKTYGMTEEAQAILELAGKTEDELPPMPALSGSLLKAPTPIMKLFDTNWPLLSLSKGFTDGVFTSSGKKPSAVADKASDSLKSMPASGDDWGMDDDPVPNTTGAAAAVVDLMDVNQDLDDGGWDLDADLDIPAEDLALAEAEAADGDFFSVPTLGTSISDTWCRNSALAADHAAAGNFESAMQVRCLIFLTFWEAIEPSAWNCQLCSIKRDVPGLFCRL